MILSFKYFQHALNSYYNPNKGDLVLFEDVDSNLNFRIVVGLPQSYYFASELGIQYYVPNGFIVLFDPVTKIKKMVIINI